MSGPLSDGELTDGCLTCPWHGSMFRDAGGSRACHGAAARVQGARGRGRDPDLPAWRGLTRGEARTGRPVAGVERRQIFDLPEVASWWT
ncbi:MAG: Rieske 2Fe-2S domain-containing protein [Streptosporangiaceae bacterium]